MMIVAVWVVYCVVIAGTLAAGASAWERAAQLSARPARWGWLVALVGAVTLPWLLRLLPERGWTEAVPVASFRLDPLTMGTGAASSAGFSAGEVGVAMWLIASLSTLAYVAFLLTRLVRASRRWRHAELDGGPVLMTGTVGPAAVGVRRGIIVLPAWVMELDAELRAMLVRHERSHVEAGDPRLLLAGLVLLSAMPWNPVVWILVLRLRNAIELDCDARVLSAGADPARYGSLLLEVGRRRSGHALVMATFAEPRMFLEERIRRIAKWPLERRPARAALFTATALFLFVGALSCADPMRVQNANEIPREESRVPEVQQPPVRAEVESQPTFTPMTVRPELLNRADVQAALFTEYPPLLRDAGIGGSPTVFFFIDETGEVKRTQIRQRSGYPALDEAALRVAATMRFSPAYNRDERVAVWVEIPIIFSSGRGAGDRDESQAARAERLRLEAVEVRGERARAPGEARLPDAIVRARAVERARALRDTTARSRPPLGVVDGPVFTPMTVRPELLNRAETQRALVRAYPPLLRDAGIGGSPTVHFFIDETGAVRDLRPGQTSDYPALDQAALDVAGTMRFSPARNRDRNVAVWVEIPITFSAK